MNIHEWCRNNWNLVPAEKRRECVDLLEKWLRNSGNFEKNIEYLRRYRTEPDFHLFDGMAIRNKLRDVMTDDQLPIIAIDHKGNPYGVPDGSQNWDDHYTGAIDELL